MSKRLKSIFFLLAFCLLTLEGFSCIATTILFHKFAPARAFFKSFRNELPREADCRWADYVSLQPYLGIRYHENGRCRHPRINREGLVGHEMPVSRDPNYFTILLLGGSVAEGLAAAKINGEKPLLETTLNEKFFSPNQKPFRIVNASIAAGQQPMQAIYFLIYGDRADAVISLEGYNEHFNFQAGNHFESPPAIWKQLAQTREADPWALILKRSAYELYASWRESPLLSRSYSAFLVAYSWIAIADHTSTQSLEPPLFPFRAEKSPPTREEKENLYVARYRGYLNSISAIAKERDMRVAFFFQPVPALQKPLTDNEKKIVGDLSYGKQYLSMITRVQLWHGTMPAAFSLLDIFRDYDDDLYTDPIHFLGSSHGNQIMADAMAQRIGKAWQLRRK
jgi:hypothetical protein